MNESPRVRLGFCPQAQAPMAPAWFSEPERARWETLGPARKSPFIGSRTLMRGLLSDELGGTSAGWALDARGHPLGPVPQSLKTSISHYQQRAAVALCAGPHGLGIDLERPHRRCRWQQVARRWFAPAELALLDDCSPYQAERLFYRLWTLKEAWVKATGRGLAGHFQAIQAHGESASSLSLRADTQRNGWQAWTGWVGSDCMALIWQGNARLAPRLETAQVSQGGFCSGVMSVQAEDCFQMAIAPLQIQLTETRDD